MPSKFNLATGSLEITVVELLSGDVTGPETATVIAANIVSNSKLAQMPANTIKGNNTGLTANALDLTSTQITAMLNTFVGDNFGGGLKGLVPAPPSGSFEAGQFLSAGGSFLTVDQSKPRPNSFALWSQTPASNGTSKFEDVTISGNYAYVAGGTTTPTLTIYNIANQASPVLKGTLNLAGSYRVAIQGNYCYVPSNGSSTLYIVNVSNPNSPTVTGSVGITGGAGALYNCVVSGNYCYISTQSKGLTVVDVTNPSAPVQVYQEGGTLNKSFGVSISGNTLYTTNYQTTSPWTVRYLKTWDVSTPTSPVLQNTYTMPAGAKPGNITLDGNLALVTDINATSRIHILDISTPTSPSFLSTIVPTGNFNSGFSAQAAKIADNYVYVPSGGSSIYGGIIDMFDISTPTNPIKVASAYSYIPNSVFGGIEVYGGYIYVADYGVAPGVSSLDVFTLPYETMTTGNVNASTLQTAGQAAFGSHIKSTQVLSTVAVANSNAGIGASVSLSNATDVAGQITFTTGSGSISSGIQLSIAFSKPYAVSPICTLTATNAQSATDASSIGVFVNTTVNGITVSFANPASTSRTYTWSYYCIETQ